MNLRRSTKLRPAVPPLTPDQRLAPGQLSYAEALREVINLKRLLATERRRNARIEQVLCAHLEENETRNALLREAIFTNLSEAMLEKGRS